MGKYGKFQLPPPPPPCEYNGGADISGEIFGNIYKNSGGLTVDYTIPIDEAGTELAFNGNMYSRSRKAGNSLQSLNSEIDGYTLFNGRVDLNTIGGGAFSLGVYVRNITDKKYVLVRNQSLAAGGYDAFQFAEPRTYGIEGRIKF